MRRQRQTLKYWTLIRLWWLGLRRPTRLALSMSLAAIVLGSAMPLTAAVGNGEDGVESGTEAATSQPAASESGEEPTDESGDGSGDARPEGDDGDAPAGGSDEGAAEGESSEAEAGSDHATGDPVDESGDGSEGDTGDEPAADEPASDGTDGTDETGDGGETADSEPGSDVPGSGDAENGDEGTDGSQTDDTEPNDGSEGEPATDGVPADATTTNEEPEAPVESISEDTETASAVVEPEFAEDANLVESASNTQAAPKADAPPVVVDPATAQKQAVKQEQRDAKAATAEIGVRILTSWLATYTVDENLPEPARVPQIGKGFAKRLTAAADKHDADWALMLSVVRALDYNGANPADDDLLDLLGRKLAGVDEGATATTVMEHLSLVEADARQAVTQARYNRAAGVEGLVNGLEGARDVLAQRVLDHPEIVLQPEGRDDVANGRIGVRVLVVLLHLAERHDDVVVSSLKTGHRLFARPGFISAHVYGQAVDIAALDGQSILGHQGPGSVTEVAVRDLISLPAGVYPKQVISLHDMGGPSFADPRDHHDHIHIGF